MNLEISLYSIAIVVVRDRIDAFNAPELRGRLDQLLAEGITRFVLDLSDVCSSDLVLDLSDVPFLDSAGMAVLVNLLKRARSAQGDVRLVWPKREETQRILRLTKFDRVFEIAETQEAALKSF